MASSSSPPPWRLLGRIAKIGDPVDQGNVGLTGSTSAQPHVSILTVSPRLFSEPKTYRDDYNPSIVAIDSSHGLLLLHVILRRATASEPFVIQHARRVLTTGLVTSYIVVDVAAKTAYAIPESWRLKESGRVGIMYSSSGYGAYVVAELQISKDSGDIALLSFDSREGQWVRNPVRFSSPLPPSRFNPDCVLSHDGKLWWIDLSCGLIAWDTLTKSSSLSFFNLPPGKSFQCNRDEEVDLGRRRCVAVSNNKIHFIDMDNNNKDRDGRPKISVWMLQSDEDPTWSLEYETGFHNIWSHESYRLPRRVPVLAFIHPTQPWTIYFFVDRHLFGIDLQNNKLVECAEYRPEVPSIDRVSSRFFHVCSGSTGGVADSTGGVADSTGGVREEFLQGKYPHQQFTALYDHWRQEKLVIKDINTCSGQNGQTIACATQALKDWNERNSTSYEVDLTEPMDSNAFNKSHEFEVQQSYFHVNFYGKSAENEKQLFFAELEGLAGPEKTITVMPLGHDEDAAKDSSAEHICYCCSGLMHPYLTEFVGCEDTATHQYQ